MNSKLENVKKLNVVKPLKLDCGKTINNFPLAYETYGKLNDNKDNAILIFHALTGDQFVTGTNPITNKEGWWVTAVGPDKAIDTNKYFVICANVIGGCMGSLGPRNINPETKKPYGLDFPVITIRDMVRAQESLLEHLGIKKLLCATGEKFFKQSSLQFCQITHYTIKSEKSGKTLLLSGDGIKRRFTQTPFTERKQKKDILSWLHKFR